MPLQPIPERPESRASLSIDWATFCAICLTRKSSAGAIASLRAGTSAMTRTRVSAPTRENFEWDMSAG